MEAINCPLPNSAARNIRYLVRQHKTAADFLEFDEAGYNMQQSKTLHIYHAYVTRFAIAVIPINVLAIMWLVIAKPNLILLW